MAPGEQVFTSLLKSHLSSGSTASGIVTATVFQTGPAWQSEVEPDILKFGQEEVQMRKNDWDPSVLKRVWCHF